MTEEQEQTPAFRSYDGMFRYAGPTGHEGCCYLQVFERRGALPVIVACETKDNPGASVTNAGASIATQAWRQLLSHANGLGHMTLDAGGKPSSGIQTRRNAGTAPQS